MLGTALAQLRHGFSLVAGRRPRVVDIEHVVAAIIATRKEFGDIGDLAAFRGASLTVQDRGPVDDRRLARLAQLAYQQTAYYRHHFDTAQIRPDSLSLASLQQLPITRKQVLRDLPEAFVNRSAQPWYRAETTGTTAAPTTVWFSRYEADLLTAMTAISFLIDYQLGDDDILQINLSSRAFFAIHCLVSAAALIGAAAYSGGLTAPEVTLARLATTSYLTGRQSRPTLLITYSSYLGLLVQAGETAGYSGDDFKLKRIMCGGEVLTDGLRRRAERLFGARVVETYAMTEISPMNAQICEHGHLHFHPEQGVTEVLDLTGTRPAQPGELGVLTFTPAYPYRQTTLLLRLFSEDVVRTLAAHAAHCQLAHLPATSPILGKQQHLRQADGYTLTPRDVLEIIEDDPAANLPSRWAITATPQGLQLHVLGHDGDLADRIHDRGRVRQLPIHRVVLHRELATMPPTSPVRADLRELSIAETIRQPPPDPDDERAGR